MSLNVITLCQAKSDDIARMIALASSDFYYQPLVKWMFTLWSIKQSSLQ